MNAFLRKLARTTIAATAVASAFAASAAEPDRCVAVRVPTDSQDVSCPLAQSLVGRPLRFVAEFVGSHDDTRLRLEATLDGEPLTCEAGSKTELFAEDGAVHLDCRFTVTARKDAAARLLKVALTVHHAQYLSAGVVRE